MDLLEKLLVDLHASIDSEDQRVDAVSLVASIEAIAFGEMDATDLEFSCSLLLRSTAPPSLMKFLFDSSRSKDKEIIGAKKHALKFLALYCKVMAQIVSNFAEEMVVGLIDLFRKETSGEVKACLLLPVKNILRTSIGPPQKPFSGVIDELEPTYRVILDELNQSPSKISKGMRCEGLKSLGLLVAAFPAEPATVQAVTAILALCQGVLQTNFAKGCKEVDFSAIAGAFSCLDRCLCHFEDRFSNSAELWRCLLQAVMAATAADTSRYAACAKAARLIAHHAELFRDLIGLNAQQSYGLVAGMCAADKKALAKHSTDALHAVLQQIAAYVVDHQQQGQQSLQEQKCVEAVRTVRTLYAEYLAVIEGGGGSTPGSGGQEGLMRAVRGMAAIAPAVVAIAASGGGSEGGSALSVDLTVRKVVEAAQHQARYAEAVMVGGGAGASAGGSQDSKEGGGKGATLVVPFQGGGGGVAAAVGEEVEAEGELDTGAQGSDEVGYGASPLHYRKVLFLNAATSFISAVIVQPSPTVTVSFTPGLVEFLEEYVLDAVVSYSRFWAKQQSLVTQTLCTLAHALMRLPPLLSPVAAPVGEAGLDPHIVLNKLLDCVSSALLLRTISRRSAGEAINPAQLRLSEYTGQGDDRLLFSYLDLWQELLAPTDRQVVALLLRYYQPSYATAFAQRLYETLLNQLLQLLQSLDLSYDQVQGAGQAQDRVLVPRNIADQDVLLNLVTFLEQLLPRAEKLFPGRLAVWLPALAEKVVPLAERLPLLSALYRLLTCTLRVVGEGSAPVASTGTYLAGLRSLLLSLQHRAATLAGEFTQELLESVVSLLLLAAGAGLLSLSEVVVTLRLSLSSGVQALQSVTLLTKQVLREKASVVPHLPQLLPFLDGYLTAGPAGAGETDERGRLFLRSQAALTKMTRASKEGDGGAAGAGSYAAQVQGAVLELLGRLGGLSQHLLRPASETVQDSLVWSDKECLVFSMTAPEDTVAGVFDFRLV